MRRLSPHIVGSLRNWRASAGNRAAARTLLRTWIALAGVAGASMGAPNARAACLTPPGDVNGNGTTNVADVQCVHLGVLWQLASDTAIANGQTPPAPPTCAFGGTNVLNLNCAGGLTVADAQACVFLALGIPLDSGLDSNGNQCFDACESQNAVCGNGSTEIGEECDDGVGNSDTLADFCRTTCLLPACGDGVVDTGEQCDDHNTVSGDGCENDCSYTGGGAFPLPYVQAFTSSSYGSLSWTVDSDAGSAANNWTLVTSGPLGPDIHPRYFGTPAVTNYVDRIISPLLNASTATYVTLSFDQAITVTASATATTTFKVLASSNGGTSWTTVWSRTGLQGNLAATRTTVDVSAALAGSSQARVAFEIAGPSSSHVTYWEVDQFDVRSGAPPVIAAVPNQSITAGTSTPIDVSATDLDTPPANLVFSLVGAPSFATIVNNNDGTATMTLAPSVSQTGNFPGVTLRCTDGTFTVNSFFDIFVAPSAGSTPAYVVIRSAGSGGGSAIDTLTIDVGQNLALYCAAYNSSGSYLSDTPCTWSRTGTIPTPPAGPAASIVYQPNAAGSGFITATPTTVGVTADQTGTLTVQLPTNAGVNLATSTVDVVPNAIEANGTSTATVTVSAYNTLGLPITGATIVINTTSGTMQGTVTEVGNGVYTQVIRSSTSVGTAAITASVNGTTLTDTAQLSFVNFFTITGTSTIFDCDNIALHVNKNLVVSGTLTINSNPTTTNPSGCAAQMKFGDVIVTSTGTLTHSETTTVKEYWMDIEVKSLIVEAGGQVNVNGRGYVGAPGSPTNSIAYWLGNTNAANTGAATDQGGSHGGMGGRGSFTQAYGSMFDPRTLGGGGGRSSQQGTNGGDGGGAVRIKAIDSIIVHGTIQANAVITGQTGGPGTWGGGGAGGSISLETPSLGGSGTIQANGANVNTTTGNAAGGGGGGRIAVRGYTTLSGSFATATISTNMQTRGGVGGVNGGAGTVYLKPATGMTYGWLIVDNNGSTTPANSTPILLVPQGISNAINGTTGTLTDFAALWRANAYVGSWITPNTAQPGSGQGPGNVQLFRVTANSDIDLQLTGAVALDTVASANSTYRGVLALNRLDVRGNAALSVPGDILVVDGNNISPQPGVLNIAGRIDALSGANQFAIDLNTMDTVNVSTGGLVYGDLFGSDNPNFPFSFSLSGSLLQTDVVQAAQFVATSSSIINATTLAATGNVDIQSSTATVSSLSGNNVIITSGSGTIGSMSATVDMTINNATYTVDTMNAGQDIILDGSTQVTVRAENVNATRRVDLRATSILRHEDIVAGGSLERLNITTQSVIVGASASIDVSGRGFRSAASGSVNAYTIGNVQTNGASNNQGGSHGGLGGNGGNLSPASVPTANVYGSVMEPSHAGGGGGFETQFVSTTGGHGGGVVRIQASALVRVDGTIRANGTNGANSTYGGGGGAGGSIWITTQQIAGTGTVEANGGNGGTGNGNASGGGGGGRIAVRGLVLRTGNFAGSSVVNAIRAYGGNGAAGNRRGGAGTIFLQSATQTFGDLIVDNNGVVPPKGSTPILVLPQGTVGSVSGSLLTDGGAGWTPNRYAGSWVNPDVDQAGANAPISAQTFFYVTSHSFSTLTTSGSVPLGSIAQTGETYRGVLPLERLEVRGRASLKVDGDVLVLLGGITAAASNTIFLGGEIIAQRIDFNNVQSIEANGGGLEANVVFSQGGSNAQLNLNLTNSSIVTLPALNAGTITSTSSTMNIAGAIAVNGAITMTSSSLTSGPVTATGLATFTSTTLNAAEVNAAGIIIEGGSSTLNRLTSSADIELRGSGTTVTIDQKTVQATGALRLLGTSQLRHCATTASKTCSLEISVGSMLIEASASIDVSARGYLGATNTSPPAYWKGNTTVNGAGTTSNMGIGGSHGGLGGLASLSQVYDSLYDPLLPGAGGGYSANAGTRGGNGGGAIKITASQFVAIDGAIRANGENGTNSTWGGGGGAGGSINITTPQIGGNGTLQVNGGAGGANGSGSGGGSGGRIALRGLNTTSGNFTAATLATGTQARGGTGGPTNGNAGAGTVYVFRQGQQYGDLVIDNNNLTTSFYSTPIRLLDERVVSAIEPGNVLVDASGAWETNQWAGYRVNPNVNQPQASSGLTQQQLFLVLSNTDSKLALQGTQPLGNVTSVGATYRGVLALDNLEVRGRARVEVNGDVLVLSGDLASASNTAMGLGGVLKANVVDLNLVNTLNITNGGFEANQLFAAQSSTFAFDWNMNGGSVTLPSITSDDFSVTGGTVTTGAWSVAGNLTVDASATITAGATTVGGTAQFTSSTTNLGHLTTGANAIFIGGNNTIARITATGDVEVRSNGTLTLTDTFIQAGGVVRVLDSGYLTHCETSTTKVCGLDISANLVSVAPSATINVNGRGYLGAAVGQNAYTTGNLTANGATTNMGGSHGGRGGGSPGTSVNPAPNTNVYGNYTAPSEGGGGGGWSNQQSQAGADGGGFIRINATQSLVVDGTIQANGNSHNSWAGGGAGGGIDLIVGSLAGTGTIQANGGTTGTTTSAASGGGSGGRIAIKGYAATSGNFALPIIADNVRAFSGWGASNQYAGAGTVYLRSATDTFGSLIVDNNNANPTNADSTPILIVPQGTVQALNVGSRTVSDFSANWPAGRYAGTWFNPNVAQPAAPTGLIDQIILPIASHTTTVMTLGGTANFGTVATTGSTYRGVLMLDRLTVRRRADVKVDGDVLVMSGNVGGSSTTTFTMTGTLEALTVDLNQIQTLDIQSGGIQAQEVIANKNPSAVFQLSLAGSGATYQENTTHVSDLTMGSGAVLTTGNLFASGNVSITSATLNATDVSVGGTGTLVSTTLNIGVLDVTGKLTMNGGNNTVSQLLGGDEIELRGGAAVTINNAIVDSATTLKLLDSGTTLRPCETSPSKVCSLDITAPIVSIGAGSVVNANGRGYTGAAVGALAYASGNSTTNGATTNMGGSHGGRGGGSPGTSVNPAPVTNVYGNFTTPSEGGGGGGWSNQQSQAGADGGGFIRIHAAQGLVVDGSIQANGDSHNSWAGGGAGGGIDIVAGSINGTGTIQANGGTTGTGNSGASGGGSGGRIAIKGFAAAGGNFALPVIADNVRAFSGWGGSSLYAGAGTIYIRGAADTYGSLIVDNGGNTANPDSTPILTLPQGTVQSLDGTARTITDFGANWAAGRYAGTWVNPNVAQAGAATGLTDQEILPIAAHTSNVMTLGGTADLAAVSSVGSTYRGTLMLERLTVRRRADVKVDGDVLVLNGNVGAASSTTFSVSGILECMTLDLNTTTAIDVQGGGIHAAQVFGSDSPTFAFGMNVTGVSGYGGLYQEGTTYATTLTMGSGGTLTTGNLNTTGNVSITSATLNTTDVTIGGSATFNSTTLNLGVLNATGAILMNGGNNTVGELRSSSTIDLRGGVTVTINNAIVQATGALQLLDGGTTLQHCETSPSTTCSLLITAPTVYVAPSTTINATGRGYTGAAVSGVGYTSGNSTSNGAPVNTGGSHGGRGGGSPGTSVSPAALTNVYGNFVTPSEGGGGGGWSNQQSQAGADGGGFIRINASQGLVVDGTIQANGNNHNSWAGGGAGGGIDLNVATLAGTGTIQANGGTTGTTTSAASGGGSGGRIAIKGYTSTSGSFAPATIADNVRAFSGWGANSLYAGAGTIYLRGATDTYGSLIVDNGGNLANADSTPILILPQGQVLATSGNTLTDFGANWAPNRYVGTWVNPDINQPGAANGVTTQSIFPISAHTANQLTVTGAGFGTVTQLNDLYRGVLPLEPLTVRRRADVKVDGDILVMNGNVGAASNATWTLDGTLEAYRLDLNTTTGISVTQGALQVGELIGTQSSSYSFDLTLANGTSLTQTNTYVDDLTIGSSALLTTGLVQATGNVTITNGNLVASDVTVAGTLAFTNPNSTSVLSDVAAGVFDLNGGSLTVDTLLTSGNATIRGAGQLTVAGDGWLGNNLDVGGTLALQDTARLWHPEATTSTIYRLNVLADVVSVATSARIDVTGRGYIGGPISQNGYSFGNTQTLGSQPRNGGSHGGLGALGNAGGTAGAAYGSLYDPALPGGGGGRDSTNNSTGADGGGVIWIEALTAITCDGGIWADGNSIGSWGAGGAGGSVRLVTPTLTGAGTVSVRGGSGGTGQGSAGGGGGRISVQGATALSGNFALATAWNGLKANGGIGFNSKRGGAGTIYVHMDGDTDGSLILDNENTSYAVDNNSTPLVSLTGGTVVHPLPANNILQDNAGNWMTNFYAGSWVTPNIAQGNPARRNDDLIFAVTSNTLNALTLSGDISGIATGAGLTYRGIYRFKNLELRNNARLQAPGDLVVVEGDISSNNTTTLNLPSGTSITGNVIDLNLGSKTGAGTITGTVVP